MKFAAILKKIIKSSLLLLITFIVLFSIWAGGFGSLDNSILHDGNALLFAHRGVTINHVENSIGAFEDADRLGFIAIETDVNVTKDGTLIIFHDHDCKRLLNVDKKINEMTWDEIQKLQLYHNGHQSESKVLSLSQFLDNQSDSTIIYLDMKKFSFEIADRILSIIANQSSPKKILIADASILYLSYLKYKNPQVSVVLEGFNKGKEWTYSIIPKKFKPDYYASYLDEVDQNHMEFLAQNSLLKRRIVYGVGRENIPDVYKLGLQNIIYDYEDLGVSVVDIKSNLMKNKYK